MVTPPPQQSRQRSAYSASEKQSLLDNFDLEGASQCASFLLPLPEDDIKVAMRAVLMKLSVADKTRAFKSTLEATLSSFSIRQETEMMKIPLALRKMTLEDLEAKWGVSWSAIVQRIAREKMEEREKAEAAAAAREHAEQEEAKLKRYVRLQPLRLLAFVKSRQAELVTGNGLWKRVLVVQRRMVSLLAAWRSTLAADISV